MRLDFAMLMTPSADGLIEKIYDLAMNASFICCDQHLAKQDSVVHLGNHLTVNLMTDLDIQKKLWVH